MNANAQTRVTLKKVHYSAALSDETYAYTAQLHLDGRHVADCENRGNGGETMIWWKEAGAKQEVADFCATLDPMPNEWGDRKPFPYDAELLADGLVTRWLTEREVNRHARTKVLFRKADDRPGAYSYFKVPKGDSHDRVLRYAKEKYPAAMFHADDPVAFVAAVMAD